jgi:hypothetical protein
MRFKCLHFNHLNSLDHFEKSPFTSQSSNMRIWSSFMLAKCSACQIASFPFPLFRIPLVGSPRTFLVPCKKNVLYINKLLWCKVLNARNALETFTTYHLCTKLFHKHQLKYLPYFFSSLGFIIFLT